MIEVVEGEGRVRREVRRSGVEVRRGGGTCPVVTWETS